MMKLKSFIFTLSLLAVYALPQSVFAAPPKLDQLGGLLDSVLNLITPVGALLAVGMFVYGGYMWMISEGDSGKIQQAQGVLTWAIFGLVFLAIFRLVLKMIFDFIGN